MTSRVQHRRSLVPGNLPAAMAQGELAVNIADGLLFTSDTGNPIPLIGVRAWMATARYMVNDIVAYNGATWRAIVQHGPAAWNPLNWATTADANTQAMIDASLATFTMPVVRVSDSAATGQALVRTATAAAARGVLGLGAAALLADPIPLGNGGTGATNAGTARINLGLNTATGEFIVQKDGTVAAPGIAFALEPGLGWYRVASSQLGVAIQGQRVALLAANDPASTSFNLNARTPGGVSIGLINGPSNSTNYNLLSIIQTVAGGGLIATSAGGTAPRGSLTLDAPTVAVTGNFAAYTAGGPAQQGGFGASGDKRAVYWYTTPEYSIGTLDVSGLVALITNGVQRTKWQIDGVMIHNGQALKPGGGPWVDTSDARVKHDVRDYDHGLKHILALRPRTFKFKPETGREQRDYVGLIYQETDAMPEMQFMSPEKLGDIELDDMGHIDTSAVTYALINAVKTLHQRLSQLEHA